MGNPMLDAIAVTIQSNTPLLMIGEPGTGKTTNTQFIHERAGAYLETVIASLRDPTDFGGLPIKVAKSGEMPGVLLAAPQWAHRLRSAYDSGKYTWVSLFIDEITTAAPATQAALLRVIMEKVVGDYDLPFGVRMIAAANPADQAAGGWDLAAPLANRFFHLPWQTNATNWSDGFINGFPMPAVQSLVAEEDVPLDKYKLLVAGYIRSAGRDALLAVPKDEAKAGGPWPSPRTWEMVARLLAYREALNVDEDVNHLLMRGSIGEAQGIAFHEWLKAQNLPNPRDLLDDADNFKLPERGDIVFVVLNSVVREAITSGPTDDDWIAAWKILGAAGDQGAYDVGAAAARHLAKKGGSDRPNVNKYIKPYIEMLKEAGLIKPGMTA